MNDAHSEPGVGRQVESDAELAVRLDGETAPGAVEGVVLAGKVVMGRSDGSDGESAGAKLELHVLGTWNQNLDAASLSGWTSHRAAAD